MSSTQHLAEIASQCFRAGDLRRAEEVAREALLISPEHADWLHLLGVICHHLGRNDEAVALLEHAARIAPLNPSLQNNLGVVTAALGRVDAAMLRYREALRLKPNHADAYTNLGNALFAQERFAEAAAHHREALRIQPNSKESYHNLGAALAGQGQLAEAEHFYREALRLDPNYLVTYTNLASLLVELGRADEAIACCQEALRLDPASAPAYYCLGELSVQDLFHFSEDQLRSMDRLLTSGRLSCDAASGIHFVRGALSDRQGDYDQAFTHYRQANDLRAQFLRQQYRAFNAEGHIRYIDEVIATFDRRFVERAGWFGLDTEMPVFVVGMPRSGTTLVAQILSSHPQVVAAGELRDLDLILNDTVQAGGLDAYPRYWFHLDQAMARALAECYMARLTKLGKGATRVVDKMPHNFRHLGAIWRLFPRARVIHCRRDIRDVCLSCYFQNFTWLNYTCSLEHIGLYYRQYERLMRHWQETLPLQMYEVQYEEMVANQERISRELVAFCGLDWSDRCLDFHENARAVQTASKLQVRRPIYTTSVGRWKRYEKHLLPLEQALRAQTVDVLDGIFTSF